ncbi:MAG: DNA primase [Peptococcaceae bacterium]
MSTGYIPQEILDEIVARCDIVSVVNEYVPLKRKGSNYQGLCPFHNEKTPSFSVSPAKQIFHCFGCGKGGNVFRFIMEIEGVSFLEAVEKLAGRAGVKLPEKEMTAAQRHKMEQRKRYLQINDFVARYYQKILLETAQGKPYREYLKKRQIEEETIRKFQLGATPDGWDGLYQNLKNRGVREQEMLDLGLISATRKTGKYVDRFRQRLMFPIGDERGNIIAFGGRIIDKESSPQKYLNSPDTPLFHKSRNLYGLHLARNSIRNADQAILVEGYMDVISCHQYGITNAVAPLGTAFTPDQGRLLMRSTYQIGISFDGDAAGVKATMRCLDILSELGCTARVIQIPDQADPDEYLKKYGKDAFEQLIADGQELIMYKIARYMETTNTDTIAGKMHVVAQLLPDLRRIQSAVARETAVRKISLRLQVSETAIWEELRQIVPATAERVKTGVESVDSTQEIDLPAGNIESKVEKHVLYILFERPDLLPLIEEYGGENLFCPAAAGMYREFAEIIRRCGKVESAEIPQEKSQMLADLLMEERYVTDQETTLRNCLWQLKQEQLDQEYRRLTQRVAELAEVDKLGATKEMQDALQKLDSIRRVKKEYETSRKGE